MKTLPCMTGCQPVPGYGTVNRVMSEKKIDGSSPGTYQDQVYQRSCLKVPEAVFPLFHTAYLVGPYQGTVPGQYRT